MHEPPLRRSERQERTAAPDPGPLANNGDVKILNISDSYTDSERIGGYDVAAELFHKLPNPVALVHLTGQENVVIFLN